MEPPQNANIDCFLSAKTKRALLLFVSAIIWEMLSKPLHRNSVHITSLALIDLPESSFIKLRQNQIISSCAIHSGASTICSKHRKYRRKDRDIEINRLTLALNIIITHPTSFRCCTWVWWFCNMKCIRLSIGFSTQMRKKTVAFISNEAQFIPWNRF